jgi:hypothetical protein
VLSLDIGQVYSRNFNWLPLPSSDRLIRSFIKIAENGPQWVTQINTIKDELFATFVSLEIMVYTAILGIDLYGRFKISVEVHLQVRYMSFELRFGM